jgi:4-amino-4-deoxy-L-arabinose transferase-like glycosyltransferase
MSAESRRRAAGLLVRLAPILVIVGLVVLHATINWFWLADNVTSTGADKARHLARSLRYHQMLSPPTLRALFAVLVDNPVRPSLLPISATLAYRLLGFNVDAGPMINILYLAILLSATYGLGVKLASRKVGLLATLVVGTYPMVYAMSRLFYQEFALAAMVAVTLYFLVASDGFQNRASSLLFGLCLGLGLLTKRTFVAFALVPVLYVVFRSGMLAALWQRLTSRPRVHWRALLLALGGGALLASLWYFPNRDAVATLLLGDWLFLLWWFLAALALYLILLPTAPEINMLAALSLGAAIASVWYLARIEFILRATGFAYGDLGPVGRSFAWLAPHTYYYYLYWIVVEHISPFYFVFALLAGGTLLVLWLRGRWKPTPTWWVLGLWLVGSYALMTFTLYRQSRAILPILPPIALITVAGLARLPWKRVRAALLAIMLVGGFVQLAVRPFTPLHGIAEATRWGRLGIFARGSHIQWPDYGPTDPGWSIEEPLLQSMESTRQAENRAVVRLGLLANIPQLSAPKFQPLIITRYPHLEVDGLTRATNRGEPAYPLLFDYDFVAIKRHNRTVSDEDQAIIEGLLDDPPRAFGQAFELVEAYPLPDSDTVYLYRQRYPPPTDLEPAYVSDLAANLATVRQPGDAVLLDTPAMLAPLARQFAVPPAFYLWPLDEDELAGVAAQHERIFAVSWQAAASQYAWLDANTYPAGGDWFGDIYLATYGTAGDLTARASGARFGSGIVLQEYALPEGPLAPGDVLPLELTWQVSGTPGGRYKIFAHLLDTDGQLVTQHDSEPVGGTRPTDGWLAGETVADRRGVLLPPDLPAGTYTLVVGWYPAGGGERLAVVGAGGEPLGTQLALGAIQVVDRQP